MRTQISGTLRPGGGGRTCHCCAPRPRSRTNVIRIGTHGVCITLRLSARRIWQCRAVQPATPETEKALPQRADPQATASTSRSLSSSSTSSLTSLDGLPTNLQDLCISAENNSMPGSNGSGQFLVRSTVPSQEHLTPVCHIVQHSKRV